MTTTRDIGTELRRRRRPALTPPPTGWDWGPRRPPSARKAWIVLGLVAVAAVVLASLPPAGAGPAGKGVGTAAPKTTTTTTTTTLPPPPAPVLEPMALAPPAPAPAPAPAPVEAAAAPVFVLPIPQDGITVGGHLPDWAWTEPGRLSPAGLASMAMAVGCTPAQAVMAASIALGESGGRTDAVGDVSLMNSTWSYSAGAWQIRGLHAEHNTYRTRDPQALLHDMWHNARAMHEISNGCTNWQPWTVWQINRHVQHIPAVLDAVLFLRGAR